MKHNAFILILLVAVWLVSGCGGGTRPDDELGAYDPTQYERVSIHYDLVGKGDTTLIFIHGWNLNHTYWNDAVRHLQSRYKIVSLDLAGHGDSGKDRISWTAESFARDISSIIIKENLQNVILIGHSLGSEIALEVFQQNQARVVSIIGVDSFKDVSFEITPEFETGFKEYINKFKRNYSEMSDSFARDNLRTRDRAVINRVVADYKSADPKIALAIYRNMVPKYVSDKTALQKLPFTLHIIASDYAPYNEAALTEYAKSGYKITWISGAGHFPMVEEPQQFNLAIDRVLKDIKSN